MMGPTHMLSGAAAGAWLGVAAAPIATLGLPGVVLAVFGVGLGAAAAMTPDLDHPDAKAVTRLGVVGSMLCHAIRFVSKLTTGVEHRGLSHSLVFAGLWGWATYGLTAWLIGPDHARYLAVSVIVGVVSALLGDLVTRAGLRHLMWPLPIEVSIPRVLRITTNGPAERWVIFPLVLVATVAGVAEWAGLVSWGLEMIDSV
jgi:inner membrane protein